MSNYLVSANDLTAISLGEQDTVASVLQNIAVILSTPKGTVPGYREFGIDISDILDRPENVAQPKPDDWKCCSHASGSLHQAHNARSVLCSVYG